MQMLTRHEKTRLRERVFSWLPALGPRLGPKKPQDGRRWPQDGHKIAQDGPKLAPDSPKMRHAALPNRTSQTHAPWEVLLGPAGEAKGPPNWTQYGPKMAQDGPKMAQDGGSKTPFEKKT